MRPNQSRSSLLPTPGRGILIVVSRPSAMRRMDFDFPDAPYDHEVPRRIAEAGNLEDIIVAMESLPASDRRVLVDVSRFFAEAYDARIRESEGWAGLQRHLAALILRARELDPSLRAGATLGEAILVLK